MFSNNIKIVWFFIFGITCLSGAGSIIASAQVTRRRVTVADSIEMTRLGDPYYFAGGSSAGRVALFSPDGERFVVVLRKGNILRNTNEYEMLLWRTRDVFHPSMPVTVLTMSSSSNRPAISNVQWLTDNETVVFAGERPGEVQQIYAFNLRTHVLVNVSRSATSVTDYSMSSSGKVCAYSVEAQHKALWNADTLRNGVVVSTQPLSDLLAGKQGYEGRQLLVRFGSEPSQRVVHMDSVGKDFGPLSLSPDGQYLITDVLLDAVPKVWNEYMNPVLHEYVSHPEMGLCCLRRLLLVNTRTQESHVLLDSPAWGSGGKNITWSSDSKSIVIASIYLPLNNSQGKERELRQSNKFSARVAIPSGALTPIDIVTGKIEPVEAQYSQASHELPEIVLDEDMNDPPKIFAVDPTTHRRTLLLDLNPQFQELRFAKVEEIAWKGSDGTEVKGGLYYPLDYLPGKRYPLVIQTHGWGSDRFWIDGPYTTAFAAQALAGKDIMVLQADQGPPAGVADFDTQAEFRREVARLEGGIDELDRRGLIDRERVGVIGFSRTGNFVANALAFSPYHFAAAAVQDGMSGGYFSYLAELNSNVGEFEMVLINGAAPFGDGLKTWMQVSPEFNLGRVHTPVRLVEPSPTALFHDWEWFVGLRHLGKPVDMVLVRDAAHVLEKPSDRMISQDGNVDWFAFWLQGYEDPVRAKAAQYARWRELRKLQEENEKKEREKNSGATGAAHGVN